MAPLTGAAAVFRSAFDVVSAGGAAAVVVSELRCSGVFVVMPGKVGPVAPASPAVVPGGIEPELLPGVIDVGRSVPAAAPAVCACVAAAPNIIDVKAADSPS